MPQRPDSSPGARAGLGLSSAARPPTESPAPASMPLSQPITALSLVDQTFERVADAIVVGELKPGERIREAALASRLGVSRGVLREAMQRLEGRKVVTRRSNIGVHVTSLSEQDLLELFTMREALEGMAARLAAANMSDEELDALEALLSRHGQSREIREGGGYFQGSTDQDFHFLIVRGSRNARLEQALCEELYYQLRLYRYRLSTRAGRARQAFAEHRRIVAALKARDPDRAEAAMREHLANARGNLTWLASQDPAAA
jgi:DNA-binding GntR family transcriptional regulator